MTLVSVAKSPQRFRDQTITFVNGAEGRNIDIPSASPLNYYQVISAPGHAEVPRPYAYAGWTRGRLTGITAVMAGEDSTAALLVLASQLRETAPAQASVRFKQTSSLDDS